jgi:hypothetical protein
MVSASAILATAAVGVAVGLNPLPGASQSAPPVVADVEREAAVVAREARAAKRLEMAEQRLRAAAAKADSVPAPKPAPIVTIAPAPVAPVTQSASS